MATWAVFCRLDSGKAYWQPNEVVSNANLGSAMSSFSTKALAVADAQAKEKACLSSGGPRVTFVVVQTA